MRVGPAQCDPTAMVARLPEFDLVILTLILDELEAETCQTRRIEMLEAVGNTIAKARESQHE